MQKTTMNFISEIKVVKLIMKINILHIIPWIMIDHVHPKLPDYDVIAAKFMALKKERLQNKC